MTEVCCWWCCHAADNLLGMPTNYNKYAGTFQTKGYFCSWSCMKAYIMDNNNDILAGKLNSYMFLMRKTMYNVCTPVAKAPNRTRLERFGGDMSIEEFRSSVVKVEAPNETTKAKTNTPSEVQVIPFEMTRRKEKLHEINNSSSSNEPLRMKREKPLKREQNNLEGLLGIKRTSANR